MKKIGSRLPGCAMRFDQRDAKHAVLREGVFQHLPVARLENIKRKQRMRKKQSARQGHDRYLLGQNYRCSHAVDRFPFRKLSLLTKGQARSTVKMLSHRIQFRMREVVRATIALR